MSTRATIHFYNAGDKKPSAIIYRHSDGYPDKLGVGQDLQQFVHDLKTNVEDHRLNDATMLAARWVVRDAAGMVQYSQGKPHPLNFLSVRVVMDDPGDIEYRYQVRCGDTGQPVITCETPRGKAVEIPEWKP